MTLWRASLCTAHQKILFSAIYQFSSISFGTMLFNILMYFVVAIKDAVFMVETFRDSISNGNTKVGDKF